MLWRCNQHPLHLLLVRCKLWKERKSRTIHSKGVKRARKGRSKTRVVEVRQLVHVAADSIIFENALSLQT